MPTPGDPTASGVKPETKSSHLRNFTAVRVAATRSDWHGSRNTSQGMPPRTSRRSLTCKQHLMVTAWAWSNALHVHGKREGNSTQLSVQGLFAASSPASHSAGGAVLPPPSRSQLGSKDP